MVLVQVHTILRGEDGSVRCSPEVGKCMGSRGKHYPRETCYDSKPAGHAGKVAETQWTPAFFSVAENVTLTRSVLGVGHQAALCSTWGAVSDQPLLSARESRKSGKCRVQAAPRRLDIAVWQSQKSFWWLLMLITPWPVWFHSRVCSQWAFPRNQKVVMFFVNCTSLNIHFWVINIYGWHKTSLDPKTSTASFQKEPCFCTM